MQEVCLVSRLLLRRRGVRLGVAQILTGGLARVVSGR